MSSVSLQNHYISETYYYALNLCWNVEKKRRLSKCFISKWIYLDSLFLQFTTVVEINCISEKF